MMVGSDFSLAGHDTDLEIDYYDYNVQNTRAVPGSYLGMDPAYCVWIPPFAPGQWVDNGDEDDEDSSPTNDIEMQILDSKNKDDARGKMSINEKFQKECESKDKENFKRNSNVSTASSTNKTIVADDIISDDDLTIQKALLPDFPVKIQQAIVIKDGEHEMKMSSLLKKDDFKFVDEDDSDTAYNSEDNEIDERKRMRRPIDRNRNSTALMKETNC